MLQANEELYTCDESEAHEVNECHESCYAHVNYEGYEAHDVFKAFCKSVDHEVGLSPVVCKATPT